MIVYYMQVSILRFAIEWYNVKKGGTFMNEKLNSLSSEEKEQLASKLFSTLYAGISITALDDKIATLDLAIMNEDGYTEFRPTLKIIVELCAAADTPLKRELLAKAYSWLGAEYREKAIFYFNLYFDKDIHLSECTQYPLFKDGQEVLVMERSAQIICSNLLSLSKAYEGEHLFQLALDVLDQSWDLFPYSCSILGNKFRVLKKMNRLPEIIDIIDEALTQEWTKPYIHKSDILNKEFYRDNNRRYLLVEREKYQKLIDKGYIYRPRLKNIPIKKR